MHVMSDGCSVTSLHAEDIRRLAKPARVHPDNAGLGMLGSQVADTFRRSGLEGGHEGTMHMSGPNLRESRKVVARLKGNGRGIMVKCLDGSSHPGSDEGPLPPSDPDERPSTDQSLPGNASSQAADLNLRQAESSGLTMITRPLPRVLILHTGGK